MPLSREEAIELNKETCCHMSDELIHAIYNSFEDTACDDCKHYLSQDGKYPIDPCSECSRFYGDMFERREDAN